MSDLFRKAALSRLPALPPTRAPWADPVEGEEEEQEELDDLGSLRSALPADTSASASASSSRSTRKSADLTPLSAALFFTQALSVRPPSSSTTFRVYISPPTCVPSHHAKGKERETYLVTHHGGGASGLSFAALAKEVARESKGELGVVSWDARDHGKTTTDGPAEEARNLSSETLTSDTLQLLEHLFPDPKGPALLLLGHSMGAPPILRAAPELQTKGYSIPGVVVLDVVEGTAVEALPLMGSIIAKRPTGFKSVAHAIEWHLNSNSIRTAESARVSVPSYVTPDPASNAASSAEGKQIWRTDLLATEPYWAGWYDGLSSRFLSAKCARLLVLAGQERLDKDLMVGQMQGKFQLEVMQDVGHYLHEDNPAGLAQVLVAFWRRNTQVLVLPPKIGSTGAPSQGVQVHQVGED